MLTVGYYPGLKEKGQQKIFSSKKKDRRKEKENIELVIGARWTVKPWESIKSYKSDMDLQFRKEKKKGAT